MNYICHVVGGQFVFLFCFNKVVLKLIGLANY